MQWEALGAIGELAGAIAVVATLFYLARQIKHSNTVSSANVYQERANTRMHLHLEMANSEHLAPIFLRLEELGWPENTDAIEELSDLELYRFRQHQFASMVRFDNSYYQYRKGFLDADAWKLTQLGIRSMGPTWIRLGILETGATEPFAKEVARLVGDADDARTQ